MKLLFRITETAKRDVEKIQAYIAHYNPDAARRFFENFIEDCIMLSGLPHMGTVSPFRHALLPETVRRYPVKNFEKYAVFYHARESEGVVEIIRVVHGARDLSALFEEDEGEE